MQPPRCTLSFCINRIDGSSSDQARWGCVPLEGGTKVAAGRPCSPPSPPGSQADCAIDGAPA